MCHCLRQGNSRHCSASWHADASRRAGRKLQASNSSVISITPFSETIRLPEQQPSLKVFCSLLWFALNSHHVALVLLFPSPSLSLFLSLSLSLSLSRQTTVSACYSCMCTTLIAVYLPYTAGLEPEPDYSLEKRMAAADHICL